MFFDMKAIYNFRAWAAVAIAYTAMSIDNHVNAEVHTANDKNGVPGLKVTLNDARIRRSGKEIVFYPVFQATGTKRIGNVCIDNDRYVWIDDEEPISTYMHGLQFDAPDDGDPLSKLVEINNVPLNAKAFKKIKIVGRAPDSEKSNSGNYYGISTTLSRTYPYRSSMRLRQTRRTTSPAGCSPTPISRSA